MLVTDANNDFADSNCVRFSEIIELRMLEDEVIAMDD
jgi:hypothetical protein